MLCYQKHIIKKEFFHWIPSATYILLVSSLLI